MWPQAQEGTSGSSLLVQGPEGAATQKLDLAPSRTLGRKQKGKDARGLSCQGHVALFQLGKDHQRPGTMPPEALNQILNPPSTAPQLRPWLAGAAPRPQPSRRIVLGRHSGRGGRTPTFPSGLFDRT